MIINPVIYGGKKLPVLDNPGTAADLLMGKQLVDQDGELLTGAMPQRSAGDLSASGAAVTVPPGYYPEQAAKKVAEAAQATPGISVSSGGLITASAAQEAGYVAAGTKSATKQLTTQAAATITPGTSAKTAVAAGRYTTGAVKVAGSSNLVASNIKSGVSIFGVTGALVDAASRITCLIVNRTSFSISFKGAESSNGLSGGSLAAGATQTMPILPNSPFFVEISNCGTINDNRRFALDTGSTNCRVMDHSQVHYSRAYNSYYIRTIIMFTSAGTAYIKLE